MGPPPFQKFKARGYKQSEQLYVFLTNDTGSKKRGFRIYDRRSSVPGTYFRWICCDDDKTFVVRVDWRQYEHSVEELHASIRIDGVVKHTMVLRKNVQLMNGESRRATVSHQAATYMMPDCEDRLPFIIPPARSTFEHALNSAAGIISVNIYTASGDKLATFLFERRTEAFLQGEGFKVADRSLSKRARKAQNRLKELKDTRDKIDVQIKEAEERWDKLQKGKLARQRGPRPDATGTSTAGDWVSEAFGVVADREHINLGGQEAQEVESATEFVMDDADIQEDDKMNDD